MRENKPPRILMHDNMHDYQQLMSVVEYKYSGERVDFPTITPEQYSMVITAWKSLPKNKVVSLKAPNRSLDILYKDIQTLGAGNWLNDEIINKYISMINDQLNKSNSVYRVLHSQFFSVLSKGEKKILAGLEKQHINTHNIIIAVIHTGNHWLFIKICTGTITVYDSLASSQPEYYLNNSMVRRYRDMANWYYGV
jgi:Ulp1 family protease